MPVCESTSANSRHIWVSLPSSDEKEAENFSDGQGVSKITLVFRKYLLTYKRILIRAGAKHV